MYFDANILTWQIVWSAVVVAALNWMKKSKLPIFWWVNECSWWLNRVIAVVASGAVALGLHWHYSYDAAASGTLVITLTGASWSGLLEHGRDWLFSYVVQQSGYQMSSLSTTANAISAVQTGEKVA